MKRIACIEAKILLHWVGLYYGEKDIVQTVSKAGEQWKFGIDDEELDGFLKKYGLKVLERLDSLDLEHRYFTGENGEIVGRVNGTHCLARAVK